MTDDAQERAAARFVESLISLLGQFDDGDAAIAKAEQLLEHVFGTDLKSNGGVGQPRCIAVIDRPFSQASLMGTPSDKVTQRAVSARELERARSAISQIAYKYPHGRVLVGCTKKVRQLLTDHWRTPINCDLTHFGILRGLDYARRHVAAISVGRQELSTVAYDGLAAALTYDDEEPEEPFDRLGTGRDEHGRRLRYPRENRVLTMTDGSTRTVQVPCLPGRWGKALQNQYREEELVQFVGRLRAFHRDDVPTWFALTNAPPGQFVYDAVLTYEEAFASPQAGNVLAEVARRCGGLLSRELAYAACQDLVGEDGDAMAVLFDACGFDCATGTTSGLMRDGWSRLCWINGEGDTLFAWAAGVLLEPQRILVEALAAADYEVTACEVVALARREDPAPRPADPSDDDLANMQVIEDEMRGKLIDRLLRDGKMRQVPHRSGQTAQVFDVRDGERGLTTLSLDGWMAHEAITRYWAASGR